MQSRNVQNRSLHGLFTAIARIVGYIKQTATYAPIIRIGDEPLHLSLYVDADFGGPATGDQKSTSGCVLALEGDNSFAMLGWGSRTKKVVSRSTNRSRVRQSLCCIVFGGHSMSGIVAVPDPTDYSEDSLR